MKIIEWFVVSSKDPAKLALTVRGLLVGLIPGAVIVLQFLGVTDVGHADLQGIVDVVEKAIVYGFGFVAAVMTIWGFARKLFITIQNAFSKR